VNYEWPDNSVGVLALCMGVPPVCSPLIGYSKIICKTLSRRNRTLCNTNSAIHPGGIGLKHAVPMDRGALPIRQLIINLYDNSISNIAFNKGSRELVCRYNIKGIVELLLSSLFPFLFFFFSFCPMGKSFKTNR